MIGFVIVSCCRLDPLYFQIFLVGGQLVVFVAEVGCFLLSLASCYFCFSYAVVLLPFPKTPSLLSFFI